MKTLTKKNVIGKRNHTSRVTTKKDEASCLSMQVHQMIALKMNLKKRLMKRSLWQTNVPRNERYNHDEYFTYVSHQKRRRFPTPQTSWQNPQPRFNYYFHGYYFKCNAYGHKIAECKYNVGPRNFAGRNAFAPLMEYEIECYNCHNYGHIAKKCRRGYGANHFQGHKFQQLETQQNREILKKQEPIVQRINVKEELKIVPKHIWKEREAFKEDETKSLIVQIALKAQKKPAPWILDSGCSSHMTGDKKKFTKIQDCDEGYVKFGNNDGA